jgi:hypothetical protein
MPHPLGTSLVTSAGCTKMNAPTMIPTTIDVAAVSPMERLSSMDMSVKAARFYHALLILLLPTPGIVRRLQIRRDAYYATVTKVSVYVWSQGNVIRMVNTGAGFTFMQRRQISFLFATRAFMR